MAGRLVVLATSHRVAPGLLSAPAWDALRDADLVCCAGEHHPQRPYLEAAGVQVSPLLDAAPTERARRLVAEARVARVVWLPPAEGDEALGEALAQVLAQDAGSGLPEVEVLQGSYDVRGARLLDLVAVMDRLRSPGGCPWDAEQTHASLVPYLLEEAYETVEVIEAGDRAALREELGDLLLQVVFHARIAEEDTDEPWSVDDVAAGIVTKLVGRHPHVFADVHAPTAAHVEANWEALKAAEKGRTSVVDGVPLAQPALALAAKLLSRVERAGLDVPVTGSRGAAGSLGGLREWSSDEELGDLLLALVAAARSVGLDAEAALRAAARRFRARVRAVERGSAAAEGSG